MYVHTKRTYAAFHGARTLAPRGEAATSEHNSGTLRGSVRGKRGVGRLTAIGGHTYLFCTVFFSALREFGCWVHDGLGQAHGFLAHTKVFLSC